MLILNLHFIHIYSLICKDCWVRGQDFISGHSICCHMGRELRSRHILLESLKEIDCKLLLHLDASLRDVPHILHASTHSVNLGWLVS